MLKLSPKIESLVKSEMMFKYEVGSLLLKDIENHIWLGINELVMKLSIFRGIRGLLNSECEIKYWIRKCFGQDVVFLSNPMNFLLQPMKRVIENYRKEGRVVAYQLSLLPLFYKLNFKNFLPEVLIIKLSESVYFVNFLCDSQINFRNRGIFNFLALKWYLSLMDFADYKQVVEYIVGYFEGALSYKYKFVPREKQPYYQSVIEFEDSEQASRFVNYLYVNDVEVEQRERYVVMMFYKDVLGDELDRLIDLMEDYKYVS